MVVYDEDGNKINRLYDADGNPLEGTFISHGGFLEGVDLFPWGYEGMAGADTCDVYYLQDGTAILWAGPGEPNGVGIAFKIAFHYITKVLERV